jgi:hypothetical protein
MSTRVLRTLVVFLSFSAALLAQNVTGSIIGTVVDSTDRVLVGAKVTLANAATGAKNEVLSDGRGAFTIGGLLPGTYSIAASFTGFKSLEKTGIVLTASERRSVGNLALEVGEVSEKVAVVAESAAVQTVSAERSGLITKSQITELALIGRDYLDLMRTLPGVADLGTHEAPAGFNFNVAVQGNRPGTNHLTIDGVTNLNSGGSTGTWISPSIDSIAEVKVLLNNYQAEYGRNSGASVTVITKGGTQDFHGAGYYFKRNEAFNANDFFYNSRKQARPRYRYDFGGFNIGGPLYIPGKFNTGRDKLFFFFAQEIMPQSFPNTQNLLTVPTALERGGDFSKTYDQNGKLVQIVDPLSRLPFANNLIPTNRINANTQKLLNVFPQPNYVDASGSANYLSSDTYKQPRYETLVRVDYQINERNRFYVRGIADEQNQQAGYGVPAQGGNWSLIPSSYFQPSKGLVASLQQTISPTLLHEFSYGLTRALEKVSPLTDSARNAVSRSKLGITLSQFNPQINDFDLIPNLAFGGVPNAAGVAFESRYPFFGANNIFDLTDNLTKIRGAHTIKAGLFLQRVQRAAKRASVFNGSFDFSRDVNNPYDTGWAYSNALLGAFKSYTESDKRPWGNMRYYNIEWYGQDRWNVNRKLTLDFGLRFSIIQPQYERDGKSAGFSPDRYIVSQAAILVRPALNGSGARVGYNPVTGQLVASPLIGSIAQGDPANGMVTAYLDPSYPRALYQDRGVHLGPRLGFAYDPSGTGKNSVRGGFGITYNREDSSNFLPFTENPPLQFTPTTYYGLVDSYLSSGRVAFPGSVSGIARSGEVPTVYSYSFGIQREVGAGILADVAYAGTLGRHLRQSVNLNGIAPGADFLSQNIDPTNGRALPQDFLRPYPGLGNINYLSFDASSNYHSLQAQVHRRFTRNLQFSGVWTWSKTLTTSEGGQVSRYLDQHARYYGLASFDRTHIANINWIYSIPRASKAWDNGFTRLALDGWQLSGIASFVSGAPLGIDFTTTDGADITGSPTETARPNAIANVQLPKSEQTLARYFNTAGVARPAKGTLGNAAKTLFRGPGVNNFDSALFKNFAVTERARLQFRFESYNTFNHTQFAGVDATARFDAAGNQVNTRFGQLISSRSPRRLQLALKFDF